VGSTAALLVGTSRDEVFKAQAGSMMFAMLVGAVVLAILCVWLEKGYVYVWKMNEEGKRWEEGGVKGKRKLEMRRRRGEEETRLSQEGVGVRLGWGVSDLCEKWCV
jgi:hypothetical protein